MSWCQSSLHNGKEPDVTLNGELHRGYRPSLGCDELEAVLIYSMSVSVDGLIADREGAFGGTVPSEEQFRFHIAQTRELGGYLCGRRLYETMLPWDTDPSMRDTELGAAFADVWCAIPKVVFSRTLDSVQGNARLAGLAAGAIELGLVDELRMFRNPVVVGGGTPFLPPVSEDVPLTWSRPGRSARAQSTSVTGAPEMSRTDTSPAGGCECVDGGHRRRSLGRRPGLVSRWPRQLLTSVIVETRKRQSPFFTTAASIAPTSSNRSWSANRTPATLVEGFAPLTISASSSQPGHQRSSPRRPRR